MAIIVGKTSVPKTAYSIYQIATFEKIPHEKIKQMADDIVKKMIELSPVKTGNGIKKAFNLVGRYNYSINSFLYHRSLEPFAKGIKMAAETSLSGAKLTKCDFITFYIDKKDYELWKSKGIRYTESPANDKVKSIQTEIKPKTNVMLPLTNEMKRFKDTLTKLGYTMTEGIQLAVSFFMKQNKDIFGEVEKEAIDESLITENKTSLIQAYINPDIKNAVWQLIQRYNAVNFPHIRFSDFIEAALVEKIKSTDVRYTNPKLYAEYLELKRQNEELKAKERDIDEGI